MRTRAWRMTVVLSGIILLSACGGGGGGHDDQESQPQIFPALEVVSTTPADEAMQVPVGSVISAQFGDLIDPATVNLETFVINVVDGPQVQGTLAVDGDTVTFTPAADLAFNTVYEINMTGIADVNGTALLTDYYWSFTTTPPNIMQFRPEMDETKVETNSIVSVAFSIPIDVATIPAGYLTVRDASGVQVQGQLYSSDSSIIFIPAADFESNTQYTATLAAGITDLAGNAIPEQPWSFITSDARDLVPPTVVEANPHDGTSNVWAGEHISVTFSEPINPYSANSDTFIVMDSQDAQVAGTLAVDGTGTRVTFTPASGLHFKETYQVTLTTSIQDMAKNGLAQPFTWAFSTGMGVESVTPADGKRNVFLDIPVSITFSEGIDPATIFKDQTFSLIDSQNEPVAGTLTTDGANVTFTPATNFVPKETYTATLTTGIQDLEGNPLPKNYSWTFTTGKKLQN